MQDRDLKKRPVFHRRFEVLKPCIQDGTLGYECVSRWGLVKAFLTKKEIRYAGKNRWYDFNKEK